MRHNPSFHVVSFISKCWNIRCEVFDECCELSSLERTLWQMTGSWRQNPTEPSRVTQPSQHPFRGQTQVYDNISEDRRWSPPTPPPAGCQVSSSPGWPPWPRTAAGTRSCPSRTAARLWTRPGCSLRTCWPAAPRHRPDPPPPPPDRSWRCGDPNLEDEETGLSKRGFERQRTLP